MLNNNFLLKNSKVGWLLEKAQAKQSQVFVGTEVVSGKGMYWNPDGKNLYVLDDGSDRIFHFTFAIAWDITSKMIFVGYSFVKSMNGSSSGSVAFSNDGSKMFLTSRTSLAIIIVNLSTPWVVTGVSPFFSYSSFTVPSLTGTGIDAISFTEDGLNMYLCGRSANKIFQCKLTTSFVITTATLYKSFTYTSPKHVFVKPDGRNLYVCDTTVIYDYKMTTQNDVSTSVLVNSYTPVTSSLTGLLFSPDGFNLYFLNSLNSYIYSSKLA